MMHYTDDPVRDAERYQMDLERENPPKVILCDECGIDIYPGQKYYNIDGNKFCKDCIELFAEWA